MFDDAYGDLDERRRFVITPYGEPYNAWCEQWLAAGLLNREERDSNGTIFVGD
jgi:hypothetical protein